jgi:CRP-like cAMP-binding protein
MTESVNNEISQRLDLLIRLTAVSILSGKQQKEQVELLGRAGLAAKDIASLVGTTRNTVSVALSRMKKATGKGKKTKKKE